jgi:hypothetical protein
MTDPLRFDTSEQIHWDRIKSHEALIAKLKRRVAGDHFKDFWGDEFEVIDVDSKYPRPGYTCKKIGDSKPDRVWFIGFDSVRDL